MPPHNSQPFGEIAASPPAYSGASAPREDSGWHVMPSPSSNGGGSAHSRSRSHTPPSPTPTRGPHFYATEENIQQRLNQREWDHQLGAMPDTGGMRWYSPDAGQNITTNAPEKLRVLSRAEQSLGDGCTALPFPKLIVMGPGNTGKSTVLNRFIQFKVLPCRDGVCTKRPIKVEMRDVPQNDPRFLPVAEGGGGGRNPQQKLQAVVTITDLKDRTTEVFELHGATPGSVYPPDEAAMLEYVEARGAPGPEGWSSKLKGFFKRGEQADTLYVAEELIVKVESPGMMHFDLVDLPGLEAFEEQTLATIKRYFNKETIKDTFVLVFRDASSGSGQSDSHFSATFYGMIREVMESKQLTRDQIAHRFLGIYTKVDKSLESASPGVNAQTYNKEFAAKIEDLLKDSFVTALNKKKAASKQLPLVEWMVVLNPNANEAKANMPFEAAACKEKWFFDALIPPPDSTVREQCGIDAVRSRLMEKYSAFCQHRVDETLWEQTRRQINVTHALLESWGWDAREEGTRAEQLEVLHEAVHLMFDEASQKVKEFFQDPAVKRQFDACAALTSKSEHLVKCRQGIVGDGNNLGVSRDLLTNKFPDAVRLLAASSSHPKLKKLAALGAQCVKFAKVEGEKQTTLVHTTYVELEEEQKASHKDDVDAGYKKADLNCQGLVYRARNTLRGTTGAVQVALNDSLQVASSAVYLTEDTATWLGDAALHPEYSRGCDRFKRLRKVAEELNRTFGVGDRFVGVVGGKCPPLPEGSCID